MSGAPEMVERVARALWASHRFTAGEEQNWPRYAHHARAAIEAMREPQPTMIAASERIRRGLAPTQGVSEQLWRAMIDAALQPNGEA